MTEESIQFTETYTVFSGTQFDKPVDGITWSVPRPPPTYTMGDPGPRSACNKKRRICGSVIFTEDFDVASPFDLTITIEGDMGSVASKTIYGVEVLDEGSNAEVATAGEAYTFIVREIGPLVVKGT